jgi:hypothetical protein
MNFKHTLAFIGLITSSTLTISTGSAFAFNFTNGSALGTCEPINEFTMKSCTTADGFTLTVTKNGTVGSLGGFLAEKTVDGVTGVGIYGDDHPHGSLEEIDYGEELTLTSAQPSILQSLDLAFLYKAPAFGDTLDEIAQVTAGGITGTLSVLTNTTAEWKWNGITQTLTALSKSDESGGGWYRIFNPFGKTEVTDIKLTAPDPEGDYIKHDFSLVGAEKVPEPTTIAGLGLVAGALVAYRRRKNHKAC